MQGTREPYKQRQNRKEPRNLKIMAEIALRALAVVLAVCGFCGEGPGGFVPYVTSVLVFRYF
jgi:hypothetical protein